MSAPRLLRGFLSARDRVVVAALAHAAAQRGEGAVFTAGRQGTGYEKLDLLDSPAAERLVRKCWQELLCPLLHDAWLLRYPVGSQIPEHTDPPVPGLCHIRINVLALPSRGGVLWIDGAELPLDSGDAYVFRPDVMRHRVTPVEQNVRLVLSVGANVDAAHGARVLSPAA